MVLRLSSTRSARTRLIVRHGLSRCGRPEEDAAAGFSPVWSERERLSRRFCTEISCACSGFPMSRRQDKEVGKHTCIEIGVDIGGTNVKIGLLGRGAGDRPPKHPSHSRTQRRWIWLKKIRRGQSLRCWKSGTRRFHGVDSARSAVWSPAASTRAGETVLDRGLQSGFPRCAAARHSRAGAVSRHPGLYRQRRERRGAGRAL